MPFKKRDVHQKLLKKFQFSESPGKHEYFSLYFGGHKILQTHTSHGHDEIGNSLLKLMAKELGVGQLQYLKNMFSCTISREEYLNMLKEKGRLD